MRVLMSGGGTGGHVYPALSVAAVLKQRDPETTILFAGTQRGDVARLARDAGLSFALIDAAPVRGRGPLALAASVSRLARGTAHALRLLGRFAPDVVFVTGGYASVPVSVAARLRGVPLVLYLPDVYPGWAVRALARLSSRIAVSSDGSLEHLPAARTVVTGYPVRGRFGTIDRDEARRLLGISAEPPLPLLLVTGATQGAHAINQAVFDGLEQLLAACIVLHQTGEQDLGEAERRAGTLPASIRTRYRPLGYLEDMPAAMAAADLAVMRSGASSLAEPPAAGLPAVLVPGTFAGGHQRFNARYMASHGAAVLLEQDRLHELTPTVLELIGAPERLQAMSAATRALARPDAAGALADTVLEAAA
jgi:UDP-N-acetylglucosamine--N-acetylmuramyl-(pentapeptide) pyrophosphoryl-undecaprenol N-acetylglucosamine transferase